MPINQEIVDRYVAKRAWLARYEGTVARDILEILARGEERSVGIITSAYADLLEQSGGMPVDWRGRGTASARESLRRVRGVLDDVFPEAEESLRSSLYEVAKNETEVFADALSDAAPKSVLDTLELSSVPERQLAAIADSSLGVRLQGSASMALSQIKGDALARVTRVMEDGVRDGRGMRSIVSQARRALGVSRRRKDPMFHDVSRHVRTAVQTAANDAAAVLHAENEDILSGEQFVATLDTDTCPECGPLDGQVFPYTRAGRRGLRRPPLHPNCLLPGTRVGARVAGGLKAWYDGPAIEIETTGGLRLSVTPNHPVATAQGFRPAGTICQGDDLIRDRGDVWGSAADVEVEQTPPAIEDVFRALAVFGSTLGPASVDDLHGDGGAVDGDIQIVRADVPLERDFLEAALAESVRQLSLVVSDMELQSEEARSTSGLFGLASRPAARSLMRCRKLALHALRIASYLRPLDALCVGLPANGRAELSEPSTNDASSDPALVGQILDRLAAFVSLTKVRNVRRFHYTGHVYDLQSETGWIVADGLVVSNCRCFMAPVVKSWDDAGLPDTMPDQFKELFDGKPADRTTWPDWVKRNPKRLEEAVGPGRAKYIQDNGGKLSDLYNARADKMETLEDLRERRNASRGLRG